MSDRGCSADPAAERMGVTRQATSDLRSLLDRRADGCQPGDDVNIPGSLHADTEPHSRERTTDSAPASLTDGAKASLQVGPYTT